jgi:hypothetical protein
MAGQDLKVRIRYLRVHDRIHSCEANFHPHLTSNFHNKAAVYLTQVHYCYLAGRYGRCENRAVLVKNAV